MYSRTTDTIRITVEPSFLEEDSVPNENYFVWSYYVVIENLGHEPIQLMSRHWQITDARGQIQEVSAEGVVGEQPTIQPGEAFEYISGAPLTTPSGIMVGFYRMETMDGESFEAKIPAFSLDSPFQEVKIN